MDTPIYDELMDEFFPVRIDFDLPDEYAAEIKALADLMGIPLDMIIQDIVADYAWKVLNGNASLRRSSGVAGQAYG